MVNSKQTENASLLRNMTARELLQHADTSLTEEAEQLRNNPIWKAFSDNVDYETFR